MICQVCEAREAEGRIEDVEAGEVLFVCEECEKAIEIHVDEEFYRRDLLDHWEELYGE